MTRAVAVVLGFAAWGIGELVTQRVLATKEEDR